MATHKKIYALVNGVWHIVKRTCHGCQLSIDGKHHNKKYCTKLCKTGHYKILDEGKERFFRYSACKGTNENSWEDAGYSFEGIDNVVEVFPHEVTTIEYREE